MFFYRFDTCAFPFFEVKSFLPIDWYQNTTPRAILLHELKQVQLQECFTLLTHDSIGHLKTLCMSTLSLAVAFESEWKCYSSSQSNKKTLEFEYEFSFIVAADDAKWKRQVNFLTVCFQEESSLGKEMCNASCFHSSCFTFYCISALDRWQISTWSGKAMNKLKWMYNLIVIPHYAVEVQCDNPQQY